DRILLMSSQPGKIIREIKVEMPRPRRIEDIREDSTMAAQFVEIWHHLQEEVQRSRREED
ncbi:ABC transporter ATP-binding protein, partial [Microvirga sp. 3-52]|nr:ABC transporter ATP-binding protein [Microvirga sp. 3-52]